MIIGQANWGLLPCQSGCREGWLIKAEIIWPCSLLLTPQKKNMSKWSLLNYLWFIVQNRDGEGERKLMATNNWQQYCFCLASGIQLKMLSPESSGFQQEEYFLLVFCDASWEQRFLSAQLKERSYLGRVEQTWQMNAIIAFPQGGEKFWQWIGFFYIYKKKSMEMENDIMKQAA